MGGFGAGRLGSGAAVFGCDQDYSRWPPDLGTTLRIVAILEIAGHGPAACDSCGDIHGEESLADSGHAIQEGEHTSGEAAGPYPFDGCLLDFREAHNSGFLSKE